MDINLCQLIELCLGEFVLLFRYPVLPVGMVRLLLGTDRDSVNVELGGRSEDINRPTHSIVGIFIVVRLHEAGDPSVQHGLRARDPVQVLLVNVGVPIGGTGREVARFLGNFRRDLPLGGGRRWLRTRRMLLVGQQVLHGGTNLGEIRRAGTGHAA